MKKIEKATRDEQILGRVLGEDEWKSVLLTNVYNHFLIKTFGKETTARRKTEQLINETINEFSVYGALVANTKQGIVMAKIFLTF